MTLRYLLDTNIISEPVRPIPNANVMTKLIEVKSTVAIASIVWQEVLLGCYRMPDSRRRRAIEAYLQEEVKVKLPILPYTQEAAEWFAKERARLIPIGLTPSYADGQIAAIAKVNNLILVTRNVADYANFQDLPIENWFS
ncbi:type II toxin-antitoxin system VapC family toxin [Tychonema sp. BBK16]|uniref:type II toxin-antitoxin system VapC family toxin n=1 Tax=Tychonema sp. BBK16 TaxID=2699888 RepID=UPI001F222E55|nr:type II toxin-antitoxin system VapC family toxin [Tychonema sp. BBK16]MCF6375135.1 type II toxin-antitoxin system VapC family toxin [Tychonema sp. BBK16]